jgi:DNA-binding HxlR family transcriptional regulator
VSQVLRDTDQYLRRGQEPVSEPSNSQLFRDLIDRFTVLAETCARVSQEVYVKAGDSLSSNMPVIVRRTLDIAQTVFKKWSLEILAVTALNGSVGAKELKALLGPISSSLLKTRLNQLEKAGLVQREAVTKGPLATRYVLTHKGVMISRLGEPVFLYLRLAEGWWGQVAGGPPRPPEETPASSTGQA